MTTRKKPGRRLLSLAAALTVSLLGLSAPAHADSANINPTQKATLTLHKCVQPENAGTPANGKEQAGAGCEPINGVTFTLYKVDGIDLTTPDGWEAAKGLTVPESGTTVGSHTSTKISEMTTADGGIARWQGLDLGLYLAVETGTGSPDTKVVLGSKPFLVTLPYHTDDNQWNYDVHVYPKNSVAGIEKTVDESIEQAGYNGNDVKWTITADIPHSGQGTEITSYVITDTLPAGLTLDSDKTELRIKDGAVFANNVDYSCTGTLICTFTSEGITKLKANGGGKVVLTLVTDVTDVAQAANGVFTNKAKMTINGIESAEKNATTTWGQLTVYKYDGSNKGFLSGAKFKLCKTAACTDQDVVLTGLTTGADGKVLFPVVRPGNYHLVEEEAPAGYVKVGAQQVEVKAGTTVTPADLTSGSDNYKPVANLKQTVPQLPLTGGIGQVALAAGGIGLLVIGGAVMILSRTAVKRKQS